MRVVSIVRHGPPDVGLRLEERPTPQPGPGQILIATEAVGVNFADTLARRGLYPDAPRLPFVPGYEAAGRVSAIGPGIAGLKEGDRVMALLLFGGYGDHVLADARSVYVRPDSMDAPTAAALPVQALTAWYAIFETGTLRRGDRVLIHAAAGGVGLMAVQMARHAGAVIFGTAGSEAKLEFLRQAGVHHPINYTTQDYEAEVRRLAGGHGIDLVLDSLGGAHIAKGMRLLRAGGRLASYGYAGQSGGLIPMYLGFLAMKTLRTAFLLRDSHGFFGVNMVRLAADPDRVRFRVDEVLRLWQDGVLKPHIGARFRLDEAARAHQALETRQTTGKVLLIP